MKKLILALLAVGTITAANASSINDGAAALLLMNASKAQELNLAPLAVIKGFASSAKAPEWFTTAPADAIPLALKIAGVELSDVDLFEINEAFGQDVCQLLEKTGYAQVELRKDLPGKDRMVRALQVHSL